MTCETVTRPVLRWHGGKWILARWIIEHMPAHRIYVEPFGGAASVLLRKPRSYAEIYNDLDGEVVNLFSVLRGSRALELIESIRLTPFSESEQKSAYMPTTDPIERARRTIVRSFLGFGSNGVHQKTGFRANSNRSGTTPARDWVNYPDALTAIVERLRGVVIHQRPALEVMRAHDSVETLHYVDPPYMASTRDHGSDYAHELSDDDHVELLSALNEMSGKVILSGYPNCLYDQHLSVWSRIERPSLADGARPRTEVLWMNFEPRQADLFRKMDGGTDHG